MIIEASPIADSIKPLLSYEKAAITAIVLLFFAQTLPHASAQGLKREPSGAQGQKPPAGSPQRQLRYVSSEEQEAQARKARDGLSSGMDDWAERYNDIMQHAKTRGWGEQWYVEQAAVGLQSKGDFAKAEDVYRVDLGIQERTYGKDSLELIRILESLIKLCQKQNKVAQAQEYETQIKKILDLGRKRITLRKHALCDPPTEKIPADPADSASSGVYRGNVYLEHKDPETAVKYYEHALALVNKGSPQDLEPVLEKLAPTLLATKQFARAETMYNRLLDLQSRSKFPSRDKIAADLNALGRIALAQKKPAKAKSYFEKLLNTDWKHAGGVPEQVAQARLELARIHAREGDKTGASGLYEKVIETYFYGNTQYIATARKELAALSSAPAKAGDNNISKAGRKKQP